MAFEISLLLGANKTLGRYVTAAADTSKRATSAPKGFLAVYVGEGQKKRYVGPMISYMSQPQFQDLLNKSEEEFGYDHPMGGFHHPLS